MAQAKWLLNVAKNSVTQANNLYGKDYFPRKFAYKADAEKAKTAAEAIGIKTTVTPIKETAQG